MLTGIVILHSLMPKRRGPMCQTNSIANGHIFVFFSINITNKHSENYTSNVMQYIIFYQYLLKITKNSISIYTKRGLISHIAIPLWSHIVLFKLRTCFNYHNNILDRIITFKFLMFCVHLVKIVNFFGPIDVLRSRGCPIAFIYLIF